MTDGLCAAVERQAILYMPRKSGSVLYDHLSKIEEATGKWPEEYKILEPPAGSEFIWDTFWELRNHTKSGFSGPESISFLELDAWQRIRDFRLGNWIVDTILAMDGAYMRQWRKQDKSNGDRHNNSGNRNRRK